MVYQATDHIPFCIMDDEERHLSNFSLFRFGRSEVLLYTIFIVLATPLCLYTISTRFLGHIVFKVKYLLWIRVFI